MHRYPESPDQGVQNVRSLGWVRSGVRFISDWLLPPRTEVLIPKLDEVLEKAILLLTDLREEWYNNPEDIQAFRTELYAFRRNSMWPLWRAYPQSHLEDFHIPRVRLSQLLEKELLLLKDEARFVTIMAKEKPENTEENSKKKFSQQLTDRLIRIDNKTRKNLVYPTDKVSNTDSLSSPSLLPFKPDLNYVSYGQLEEEVQKAVQHKDTTVVTLWGASGLGKTTFAQQFALKLVKENPNDVQVFYLPCGKSPPIIQLQLDLLNMLNKLEDDTSTSTVDTNHSLLKSHLSFTKQQVLIVLDDVWETEVLSMLFVSSANVKYLVTSQKEDIWVRSSSETVKMIYPDQMISRSIVSIYMEGLQIHNGNQLQVQKIDKLINLVDNSPLSLSNIATFISKSSNPKSDPKDVNKNLLFTTEILIWLLSPDEGSNEQNESDKLSLTESTQRSIVSEFGRMIERQSLSLRDVAEYPQRQWKEPKERLCTLIQDLMRLLSSNLDEESGLQDEAYNFFKLVLVKLIMDKKLDDRAMAKLLREERTAELGCRALKQVHAWFQQNQDPLVQGNESFGRLYPFTMAALLKVSNIIQNMGQRQPVPVSEAVAMEVLKQVLRADAISVDDFVKQLAGFDKEISPQQGEKLKPILRRLRRSKGQSSALHSDVKVQSLHSNIKLRNR